MASTVETGPWVVTIKTNETKKHTYFDDRVSAAQDVQAKVEQHTGKPHSGIGLYTVHKNGTFFSANMRTKAAYRASGYAYAEADATSAEIAEFDANASVAEATKALTTARDILWGNSDEEKTKELTTAVQIAEAALAERQEKAEKAATYAKAMHALVEAWKSK